MAICHSVSGQSSSKENTTEPTGPSFKAKDAPRTEKVFQKYPVADQSSKSTDDNAIDATSIPVTQGHSQHAFDFNKLSPKVQEKVSQNKIHGKDPLEGIATVYLVEMPDCDSPTSAQRIAEILSHTNGIFNMDFVSNQLVKIYCDIDLSSVDLKATMSEKGLKFNFISKDYYVVE